MESWKRSHEQEVLSLRHQLLDCQSEGEEKVRLGQLQQQILSLQVSEASAQRNIEIANAKVHVHVCSCVYIRTYVRTCMYMYMYVTGFGKIQHFADSIKIEILLYLASIMSELQVCQV